HGRGLERTEGTQELADIVAQRHQRDGCRGKGTEGTQELAGFGSQLHQDHGCRDKGTKGTQELAVSDPRPHQGHGRGGKGTPGCPAWTPDFSLTPPLWECQPHVLPTRAGVAYPGRERQRPNRWTGGGLLWGKTS